MALGNKQEIEFTGQEIQAAINIGKEILGNLLGQVTEILRPSMSLDDLKAVYSAPLDDIILREEELKGCKYVGGEFVISYVDSNNYGCSYDLYFQDAEKKWAKMSAKSQPLSIKYLEDAAWRELIGKREIKFEIDAPAEEAKAVYCAKKNSAVGSDIRQNAEDLLAKAKAYLAAKSEEFGLAEKNK